MADDDDLVDLSVSGSAETPSHSVISLVRSSVDERWGFLLYNNRFPLMVGRVENPSITRLLLKGDIIQAINGVTVESFELAAQMMRMAKLQLNLTIDMSSEVRSAKKDSNGDPAIVSPSPVSNGNEGSEALGSSPVPSLSSPFAMISPITQQPWSTTAPSADRKVLRVDPITITPSRSNVDVVLAHLPKPPRIATYNRHECPLGPEQGFTDAFHSFVQNFIAEQALASATPSTDLRYDAISAVMKSGIARLPNELIRDITQRGGDVLRRQEANVHCSGVERDRFITQMNSMNSIIQDKKRERQEAEDAEHQRQLSERARIKEAMQLYHRMCGDGDDNLFIVPTAPATAGMREESSSHHHHGPHMNSLPVPPSTMQGGVHSNVSTSGAASFQQLMNRAIASAPLPSVPSVRVGKMIENITNASDVTVHIPMSRKQRKRLRHQQLREQVQATHSELFGTAPIPPLDNVGLPVPPILQQLNATNETGSNSEPARRVPRPLEADLPLPPTSRLNSL